MLLARFTCNMHGGHNHDSQHSTDHVTPSARVTVQNPASITLRYCWQPHPECCLNVDALSARCLFRPPDAASPECYSSPLAALADSSGEAESAERAVPPELTAAVASDVRAAAVAAFFLPAAACLDCLLVLFSSIFTCLPPLSSHARHRGSSDHDSTVAWPTAGLQTTAQLSSSPSMPHE